jgi:Domain of unknown function (DUF4383)
MFAKMGLAKSYAAIIGAVLVLLGILGFIGNPIVGDAPGNPIFVTGAVHNLIHLITGALALYVAFGLKGDQQILGVIGIGAFYVAIFLLTLVNPRLFDLLNYPVNTADHLLNLGLAIASIVVGWFERSSTTGRMMPARR